MEDPDHTEGTFTLYLQEHVKFVDIYLVSSGDP